MKGFDPFVGTNLDSERDKLSQVVSEMNRLSQAQADYNTQKELQRELDSAISQIDRRESSIESLGKQIDMMREGINLSEQELRIRRDLNAEGFGGDVIANVTREIQNQIDAMVAMGESQDKINAARERGNKIISDSTRAIEEYHQALKDAETAREMRKIEGSISKSNGLMRVQVRILEEARAAGNNALTVTEARRLAEVELQKQVLTTARNTAAAAASAALLSFNFGAAAKAAAEVARITALIGEIDAGQDLTLRLGELGRPSGGSGGGGTDPNAEYQQELDALNSYLERRREEMMVANGLEKELLLEQYDERFQTLQNAYDRGLIQDQEFYNIKEQITASREASITEIVKAQAQMRRDAWASALGDMTSLMSTNSKKAFEIGKAAALAQAAINGTSAAIAAWDKGMQVGGPPVAAAFTAMSLARTGAMISSIASQSFNGGGRQAGGSGGRTADAPRESREVAPQRVIVQGLDPAALYTGEQLQNLFEAFYNENDNRGKVFVVSQ
jgi:hypothetical protein